MIKHGTAEILVAVKCFQCLKLSSRMSSIKIRRLSGNSKHSHKEHSVHFKYCMDLVRKHDYENYLCTLMYPPSLIPTAFAIRAFDVETAQIGDIQYSSDIKTGLIRMKFWIDAIENIYKGSPPHTPTALALSECLKHNKLSEKWFLRITETRYTKLNDDYYRSIQDMEDYGEGTKSPILYLLLESIGIQDEQVSKIASHIGQAQGLVTLLRSCPYNTRRGKIHFPRESLMKFKVSGEDVLRGRKLKEVCDIVNEIANAANQHLEKARSLRKCVPSSALPLFLNTVMYERYLKQLQKSDYNVFHTSLQKKNGLLPLQLWIQKLRKKY